MGCKPMSARYTVFEDHQLLVNGPKKTIIPVINNRMKSVDAGAILVFEDRTLRRSLQGPVCQ